MKNPNLLINAVVIFATSATISCSRNYKDILINKNTSFYNIFKPDSMSFSSKDKYTLIFYVAEGDCGSCLVNIKYWKKAVSNSFTQDNLSDKYIFAPSDDTVIFRYNLRLLNLEQNLFWDNNSIIENIIMKNRLNEILLVSTEGCILDSYSIYSEDKQKILDKIKNRID